MELGASGEGPATRKIRASETSKGRPDETEYVLQSWPKVGTHVHDDVRGYSRRTSSIDEELSG